MYDSLILIDTPNISARGGRTFAPQLDLLVPIAIEYTYFPEISRSSRLPVCVGALEIVCWCRDWIGIIGSWLICNVWTKWAGNDAASNLYMWNCSRSSHTYKLVIMTMQQPPCIVYLWTFDEYHRTAVRNGCDFVDKGHSGEGSQPDCRGTILPTEDDDRMTCHDNQEQSRCSRLVSYAHKKLLSGRGCILVESISLSRIFYLQ